MTTFPARPANLKRWARDKARGASLHAWPVAGTRPSGKLTLYAWRLRFDPKLGKKSVLIWAPGWHKADEMANDLLAGRGREASAPVTSDAPDAGLTVEQVFEQCMAVKTSKKSQTRLRTVASYRKEFATTIEPAFGSRGIKTITADDISKWMASKLFVNCHRKRKLGEVPEEAKSRTQAKRLALLQLIFKWAMGRHLVDRLPFTDEHVVHVLKVGEKGKGKLVGDQRVGAVVELDEVEAAVDWLDDRVRNGGEGDPVHGDPVPVIAIRVAAYAGLRLRELVHAYAGDVSADGRFIQVVSGRECGCTHCQGDGGKFHTKNATDRVVPVAPELVPLLLDYLAQRKQRVLIASPWLFPVWCPRLRTKAKPGDQRRSESLAKAWKRCAKWGLDREDVILHDLRRTAYTNMYERSGGKVALVKMCVGHRLDVLEQTYNKMGKELLYAQVFPKVETKASASAETIRHQLKGSRRAVA